MSDLGAGSLLLAEDIAEALAELEDRADANTVAMLRRSLANILADLRRAYGLYNETFGEFGSYSAREISTRYNGVIEVAQQFLSPEELAGWQRQFRADLQDAIAIGGESASRIAQLVGPATAGTPFVAASPIAINAAVRIASTYIEGESAAFRDQIVQIVGEGVTRGWGPKKLEAQVRLALEGAVDPKGITQQMGLRQRAALIARSEILNAYGNASQQQHRSEGYEYVRWVATQNERTCPYCVARHGRIYRLNEVVAPAHPRCRCVTVPVPRELVELDDAEQRDAALDHEFWRDSQEGVWEEYAEAKGKTVEEVRSQLNSYLNKVTASEKRRFPGIQETAKAVVDLEGRSLSQAVEED